MIFVRDLGIHCPLLMNSAFAFSKSNRFVTINPAAFGGLPSLQFMKNSSIKILSTTVNEVLRPKVADRTCHLQKGFTWGRHFTDHVLMLDAKGWGYGRSRTELIPIMVLWDFLAVFPSIAHEWLWAVLEAMGVPVGLLRFFL